MVAGLSKSLPDVLCVIFSSLHGCSHVLVAIEKYTPKVLGRCRADDVSRLSEHRRAAENL